LFEILYDFNSMFLKKLFFPPCANCFLRYFIYSLGIFFCSLKTSFCLMGNLHCFLGQLVLRLTLGFLFPKEGVS
jgi:hypothetical protein